MKYAIEHSHKMSARELSNILFAVGDASKRQSVLADYAPLFDHCQVVVALHLRDNKALTEKDCIGMMIGYSKSETMNDDMKRIFQHAFFERNFSPRSLINLLHCFELDRVKSHKLFDRCLQLLDSQPQDFSPSDLIRLSILAMRYMDGRLDDVDGTVSQTIDYKAVIERCLKRVCDEPKDINMLDIIDMYTLAAHPAISSEQTFSVVFKYYRLYVSHMMIEQIDVLMSGMWKVARLDTDESRQFVADVKYRLKVLLKKHRPQAKVESMLRHSEKIEEEKLATMFKRILK